MKNLTKIIATAAMAALILPTFALAHENEGKGLEVRIGANIEHKIDRIEKGEHKDRNEHKGDRVAANATTSAAVIVKKATRIQVAADSMLSFNDRIAALIATSDATVKAALETKFAAFKTAGASAKVEAGNAAGGAAQVNASNSTTTNATLLAAAKVDLREAKGFLHDAQKGLMQILRSLWDLGK